MKISTTLKIVHLSLFLTIVSSLQVFAQPATKDKNINHDPMVMVRGYVAPENDQPLTTVVTIGDYDNFMLGIDFAETSITNNPLNPLQYYAVWNSIGTAGGNGYFTNNGLDWTSGNPTWTGMAGDVVVAYDSAGKLSYQNMYGSISGVKVAISSNNGQTWGAPVIAITGSDKNWMAADQTGGPYSNYLYGTMTASSGGNVARSINQGTSWQNMTNLSTQSLPGMSVCVGAEGSVQGGAQYVVTNSGSSFSSTYTFYKSTDGGQTFVQKSTQQFSNTVGTQVGGRNSVNNMRTRPYPNIACDNSYGPHRGRLYLVYASNNPSGNANKPDIFCRYSDDGGTTWSAGAIVNDDANSQNHNQWMPAIWCEKTNGRLYISWMDTRDCPTSDSAMIYASYTGDGVTFAPNQQISNAKMKINCTTCGGGGTPAYEGDYNGIASNPNVAMLAWTDFRNGNFASYVGYFPDFGLKVLPANDTIDPVATYQFVVPGVKLYTDTVFVSASISGTPGLFNITFPQGNKIWNYPGQIPINVTANGTPPIGVYTMTILAQGSNGTPVHKRTVTVTYVIPSTYSVVTSSLPVAGGTTSGGGVFNNGSLVTVTATPNPGWEFYAWYENGIPVATTPAYPFTLIGNRNLVAHFYQPTQLYSIAVSSNPVAGGAVSGGGSFLGGTTQTALATPNTGYTFTNWTENGIVVSTSASYSFTLAANRILVANFAVQQFVVSTASSPLTGGGTTGGGSVAYGTQVTLTATAYSGYVFENWTENGNIVSTNSSYTLTVTSNHSFVANFTALSYVVTTSSNPVNTGTTSGGGTYVYNTQVSVSAIPEAGYSFFNWSEDGNVVSYSATYIFNITANRDLVANFGVFQVFNISTLSNPANGGTTSGGGAFSLGTQATVVAAPNPGWMFVNWTENGTVVSTSASYTFDVISDRTLTANFEVQTFTISTTALPNNGGTTSGDGIFPVGSPVTVVADANNDFEFVDWEENSAIVSTDSSYSFVADANRYLVATFRQICTIIAAVNPTQAGNATGGGIYNAGEQITVQATANPGWAFLYWTENGNVVSTTASYTFTATGNRTLVAQMLSTVGTEEFTAAGVKVYPNPAKDRLHIEIDASSTLKGSTIQMVNSLGKKVFEKSVSSSDRSLNIDLQGFADGVYSIRIISSEGKMINSMVVVQK